jgi:hypothetical protein
VINIMKIYSVENEPNLEIFSEGLEALTFFSCILDLIPIFLENNCLPLLVNGFYLASLRKQFDTYYDIINIVKIIAELLIGSNEQVKVIMSYPLFSKMVDLLNTINSRNTNMIDESNDFYEQDSSIVKNICMAFSNLCASTEDNIEKIILNSNLVETIQSLYDKFDIKIKYEILFLFFNAFYMGRNHIRAEIIRLNIHKTYMNMLNQTLEDEKPSVAIIKICLKALNCFLEYGEKSGAKVNIIKLEVENENIINILEKLQYHFDTEVYDLAHEMLCEYWGDSEMIYTDYRDLLG